MFNRWRTLITAAAFLALPTAAIAARGVATDTVNMRAGPGTGYPVVDTIPAGAHVNIHGCLSNDSWCDVSWARDRGWVAASYLQSFYNDRYVYLPDYYDEIGIPVVTFSLGTYWDNYYTGRPWYHRRAHWAHYWRHHHHPHFVRNPHYPGRNLAGHGHHRFEHNRNVRHERGMTHRGLANYDRNHGRFTDHRGPAFTGPHGRGSPHFARHGGRPNFAGHHRGAHFAAPRHVGRPHFANHGGFRSHAGRSMRSFGGTAMHSNASAFGGRTGGGHIGGGHMSGGHIGGARGFGAHVGGGHAGGGAPHIGGGGPGRHH